ncbi:hypothetical protein [Lunatibacter salilacus]|uniref:hypothetical protein n=1 Tax=Lunatibacter salilacus TaxID=2483804 RepID=UPI00131D1762|nr:hypothetical protein [Lunatibacter salilacus]
MIKRILFASVWLAITSSCGFISVSKTGGSAERYSGYTENLENTLPPFEAFPASAVSVRSKETVKPVDDDLSIAVQRLISKNEEEMYISGFTILVYSGVDREEAFKTRNTLYSEYPDVLTFMQYQQPRYLVKVGRYINRIEALAWYEKINDEFPSARIIQDRFERSRFSEKSDTIEDAQE